MGIKNSFFTLILKMSIYLSDKMNQKSFGQETDFLGTFIIFYGKSFFLPKFFLPKCFFGAFCQGMGTFLKSA
jgi:hypothetical protein